MVRLSIPENVAFFDKDIPSGLQGRTDELESRESLRFVSIPSNGVDIIRVVSRLPVFLASTTLVE